MNKTIENLNITLNEEGYLTNLSQWTKEVGEEIAKTEGITMTPRHWEVINWVQEQIKNNKPLSIRGIKKSGVFDIKEFYALFPGGPLKKATKIAGVPKPKSCI